MNSHPLATPRRLLLAAAALALLIPQDARAQDPITPSNANPNEQYNLPPNFDPNYKPRATPGNAKVTVDFNQAPLDVVVKYYSSVMNRNFIIADTIQANKTINIISPTPVTVSEAYRAFLVALQMNGLTVVPSGSFLKIVESKKAIQEPMDPIREGGTIPNDARMMTAILPVENASVDDIQQIVQQFLTPDATMITYGSSLIITENAANLRRVFSGIVSGNVREDTIAQIEQRGPFDIFGSTRIMRLLDKLLAAFVEQGRMVLASETYSPCYRVRVDNNRPASS